MNQYLSNNDITLHTFFRSVECNLKYKLDFEFIAKNFPLDISFEYSNDNVPLLYGRDINNNKIFRISNSSVKV